MGHHFLPGMSFKNVKHIAIMFFIDYILCLLRLFDLSQNIFSGAYWQLLYWSSLLDWIPFQQTWVQKQSVMQRISLISNSYLLISCFKYEIYMLRFHLNTFNKSSWFFRTSRNRKRCNCNVWTTFRRSYIWKIWGNQ